MGRWVSGWVGATMPYRAKPQLGTARLATAARASLDRAEGGDADEGEEGP
jgi:hypothetical protein